MAWLKRMNLENKLAFIGIVVTVAIAIVSATWAVTTRVIDKNEKETTEKKTQILPDPTEHTEPANPNRNYDLAEANEEQKNTFKALELYLLSAVEYGQQEGNDSINRAKALSRAGRMYSILEEYNDAIECYVEAQVIFEADSEENQIELAYVYAGLSDVNRYQGNYAKASELGRNAESIFMREYGANHESTTKAISRLAFIYLEQGKLDTALWYFDRELKIHENRWGKDSSPASSVTAIIAMIYAKQGKYDDAFALYLKAYKNLRDEHGEYSTHAKTCLDALRKDYTSSGLSQPFDTWLATQLAE